MKKYFLIVLFFLLCPVISYPQYGWIQQQTYNSNVIVSITFLDQNTGYACGWLGTILKTTNGGVNWIYNNVTSYGFQAISFADVNTGWVFGNTGSGMRTTDGGSTWITMNTGCTDLLNQSHFVNANTGWAAGYNGRVIKTTNGGINWVTQNVYTSFNLTTCFFVNENTGWVGGDNGVFRKTTDGGNSWLIITTGISNNLGRMFFLNENTGWVPGTNGLIMKTTNGGSVFSLLNSGCANYLVSAYFLDATTGFVCGSQGLIIKTTNGGNNWYQQPTTTNQTLNCLKFINYQTGWVCGYGGVIMNTTTGGESLPAVPSLISPPNNSSGISATPTLIWQNTSAQNYKVQISTMPNFYVITDSITTSQTNYTVPSGRLNYGYTYFWRVRSLNNLGASDWSSVWNFSTSNLPSAPILVSPPNGIVGTSLTPLLVWDSVFLAGTYTVQVARTSSFSNIVDSLTTPAKQHAVPTGKLENYVTYFWRVKAQNSQGSGPWSSIWSFTTLVDGLTPLNSSVPSAFNLYQNYPNPFNPSTNIRFDVPKASYVKLSVYDVNGRQVESLFGGNVPAGSFEFKWNASKYSSGIYFVRLESNDYSGVIKITLLK